MTYNFDPERWYEIERRALEKKLNGGEIDNQSFERAVEDLEQRFNDMIDRLDGTYRIPGESK